MAKITEMFRVDEIKQNYESQIEQRDLDLNKELEEKKQLQAQIHTVSKEKETLTAQVTELENKLYTNFEGIYQEINNEIPINESNAMQIPIFANCVELISSAIAQMPVWLHKWTDDRKSHSEVDKDPRVILLNKAPNKHTGAYNFKKQIVKDYLIHGGGYGAIEKLKSDFGFDVEELYYLPRNTLNITTRKNGYKPIGALFDVISDGEGIQTKNVMASLTEENVLRVVDSKDGFKGTGVLEKGKKILQRALQEDEYIKRIYLNGAAVRGILSTDARLSKAGVDSLKESFEISFGGYRNGGKTPVLQEGLKFQSISLSPVDLQLNEAKKQTMSEICKLFNVPESMVSSSSNKYNSIEQNNIHFLRYTLAPIINAFEEALNLSLLDETEKERYFFKFDVEELSRATEKERTESFGIAVEKGILTINEARQKLDFNNVTGGDDLFLSLGKVAMNTKTGGKHVFNTGEGGQTEEQTNDNKAGIS